jgi:mRNA interferase RelE/StbE
VTYRIEFTRAAAKQVRKLPRQIRDRILTAVAGLAAEPRSQGAKKLVGEDTAWRIRIGNDRVIYDVLDEELIVTVVRAGHRREVYRR